MAVSTQAQLTKDPLMTMQVNYALLVYQVVLSLCIILMCILVNQLCTPLHKNYNSFHLLQPTQKLPTRATGR